MSTDAPTESWTSTTDAQGVAAWLGDASTVGVVTHARPDGDAVGSSLALVNAINMARGERVARAFYCGAPPSWYDEIVGASPAQALSGTAPDPEGVDKVVVVDTGTWGQLDQLAGFVRAHAGRVCVVDHHLRGDADVSDFRIIETTAAAVCEPVADICGAVLGLSSAAALPKQIATLLYLGIATDTGWFRHSNVTPRTLRLAADLIESGVDAPALYAMVMQGDRPGRLRLMARALGSLEFADSDRIALMSISIDDMHQSHSSPADAGGFSDMPLTIDAVRVGVLLTEVETKHDAPLTKISMRSKPGAQMIDVNRATGLLGGGGHANAAGARLKCDIAGAKKLVLDALCQNKPAPSEFIP